MKNAPTPPLQRCKSQNECPVYDAKPSDGETSVLELWEYSVPLHCHYSQVYSVPIWLQSMGQIYYLLIIYYTWNNLTVCKQMINVKQSY